MSARIPVVLVVLGGLLLTSIAAAQGPSIVIDSIEANKTISGRVLGMDRREFEKHKIIVYVHTDKWYVHPFVGDIEGKSWAAIRPDGVWSISTELRDFPADQIAVFVVDRGYKPPAKMDNVRAVQSRVSLVRELRASERGKL